MTHVHPEHPNNWPDNLIRKVSVHYRGHQPGQLVSHEQCKARLRAIAENNHEWADAAIVNTLFYKKIEELTRA